MSTFGTARAAASDGYWVFARLSSGRHGHSYCSARPRGCDVSKQRSLRSLQGSLLDLHEHSGQRAVRGLGLHDAFLRRFKPGEDAKRVVDRAGAVLLDRPGDPASVRPEVDRGGLRRLLLNALPSGTIRWGHKVTAVNATAPGHHAATFADGLSVGTTLLVGADGA